MKRFSVFLITLPVFLSACGGAPADTAQSGTADNTPVAAAPKSGQELFRQCVACHTVDKGGRNGIGPNLHGIVGRAVASADGYGYTPALKAKGGTWDAVSLDTYLADPRTAVPGNKMAFAGVKDAKNRAALIAYLGTL